MESTSGQPAFLGLHAAWFGGSILAAGLLYVRPRPKLALLILILAHGLAFLGYYGDIERPYAVGASSDRPLGVGMAMNVADGGSPFHHVQVEFGNLEPFWTFTVAALSGFSSDRVPMVYDHMALLVLTLTALGFYLGWGRAEPEEDQDRARWRGVFVAAGVLGLSSMAMSSDAPLQSFWQANFVFKPNHSLAFGLVGLLSRFRPGKDSWLLMGLIQALLIWAFILDWAYLVPGLFLAALMSERPALAFRNVTLGTVLGLVLGLPYIAHLLRDYNPVGKEEMPEIWRDLMGERLNHLHLWTTDQGPLLVLAVVALVISLRRSSRQDGIAAFLLTGPLVALGYLIGIPFGFAPEPDEGYYYARMVAGAGAGYALFRLASGHVEKGGRRAGLVFGLILAVSYPAYFNPHIDDRYYGPSLTPLPPPVMAAAEWLRQNTSAGDVLVSSEGIMLSGLTGRRFLMVRPGQTADREEREQAERDILTSLDEAVVRRAAARYGVTHLVLDGQLGERYGDEVRGLGNRPWFQPVFANSFVRILSLKRE